MTREQLILPNMTDLRPSPPDHVATGDMELVKYCKYLHEFHNNFAAHTSQSTL